MSEIVNINQNLGRRLLLEENRQSIEVNIQNGSRLIMERNGDSIIIHLARNKDQSFFSWLGEVVGAAAYGVYSYGRDATIGVARALSFLYPKDWEASKEATEVAEMVEETFSLLWRNLDKAFMLFLIGMQMDTRGKMFAQITARFGTGIVVGKIGMGTKHPVGIAVALAANAAAFAGMIYKVTNDVRILKQKGENVENITDVILSGILTGDTDLKSMRQIMGSDVYNQINEMIDNDQIKLELDDVELQFLNFIREEIGKIARGGIRPYLENVLVGIN